MGSFEAKTHSLSSLGNSTPSSFPSDFSLLSASIFLQRFSLNSNAAKLTWVNPVGENARAVRKKSSHD